MNSCTTSYHLQVDPVRSCSSMSQYGRIYLQQGYQKGWTEIRARIQYQDTVLSYQYRNSHYNGYSFTGKMTFLYWISPQTLTSQRASHISLLIGWGMGVSNVYISQKTDNVIMGLCCIRHILIRFPSTQFPVKCTRSLQAYALSTEPWKIPYSIMVH